MTSGELVSEVLPAITRDAAIYASRHSFSGFVQKEDAENISVIGLIKASKSFDPLRGVPFYSYAKIRALGEVKDEIRKQDLSSRRIKKPVEFISTDEPNFLGIPFGDTIEDEVSDTPFDLSCRNQNLKILAKAINQLAERQRQVIIGVFFEGKTQFEIAQQFGVTDGAISLALKAALKNLKRILLETHLKEAL